MCTNTSPYKVHDYSLPKPIVTLVGSWVKAIPVLAGALA